MTTRAQKSNSIDRETRQRGRPNEIQKAEVQVAARVSVNIDGKRSKRWRYSFGIVIAAVVSQAKPNVKETTPLARSGA